MRKIECPVSPKELRHLYLNDLLTDQEIAQRLPNGTTKRVLSWRKRFGIETLPRWARHQTEPLEGLRRSLLIGSMLGDGRLSSRGLGSALYTENHCAAQECYLRWKVGIWGSSWVQSDPMPVHWNEEKSGWRFHTITHGDLYPFWEMFYGTSTDGFKRLPHPIDLDPFMLAVWYMDDGNAGWWPNVTLGVDEEARGYLLESLQGIGLDPTWKPGSISPKVGVFQFKGEDQAAKFRELVAPHIPSCMERKLVFGYDTGRNNLVRAKMSSIRKYVEERILVGCPWREVARDFEVPSSTMARYLTHWGQGFQD